MKAEFALNLMLVCFVLIGSNVDCGKQGDKNPNRDAKRSKQGAIKARKGVKEDVQNSSKHSTTVKATPIVNEETLDEKKTSVHYKQETVNRMDNQTGQIVNAVVGEETELTCPIPNGYVTMQ